ncbi:hypothetical protein [Streptomyces sp. NBC_01304]|uniref:hypothetical protein n=1 Tax=Streptomyces sp. NBC_01304 TaxID=2903818 RepID=UPI002E16104B|nr:hypothetical protein OG430_10780 [Streptomyces sp. NBC_01304]
MPGIDVSLLEAISVPGARGAALVDWTCGFALHCAGESPGGDPETAAARTAELARLVMESGAFDPGGARIPAGPEAPERTDDAPDADADPAYPVEDLIITTRDGYHLIRFVEGTLDSSVFLHLWLDRDAGNLALARLRLQDLTRRLVLQ